MFFTQRISQQTGALVSAISTVVGMWQYSLALAWICNCNIAVIVATVQLAMALFLFVSLPRFHWPASSVAPTPPFGRKMTTTVWPGVDCPSSTPKTIHIQMQHLYCARLTFDKMTFHWDEKSVTPRNHWETAIYRSISMNRFVYVRMHREKAPGRLGVARWISVG